MPLSELDELNQREFGKLVLSLKANPRRLNLLLAICDDYRLQAQLINAYEAELKAGGIIPCQARLDPQQPSLRATLEDLLAQESALQAGEPAVVSVLDASELLRVHLTSDQLQRFFISLQGLRQAPQQFEFPIVFWLPRIVAADISQQAPDFWSSSDVFGFVAHPYKLLEPRQTLELGNSFVKQKTDLVLSTRYKVVFAGIYELRDPLNSFCHLRASNREIDNADQTSRLAIGDLPQQIAELEYTGLDSSLLISLYNTLGEVYEQRHDYPQALELYEKASALANATQNLEGQVRSLHNLGGALRQCGRSLQAIEFYKQALLLYRRSGDRSKEAAVLHQLGLAYYSLGRYEQAIDFYQQSFKIKRTIGNRRSEANSLNSLGNASLMLGQYPQASEFYQQSLAIARELGNRRDEANTLARVGIVHQSRGQYQQALNFHQPSLEIKRAMGDRWGEANSLFDLGNLSAGMGQYQQAIDFYQKSLAIAREVEDRQGEADSLNNLGCLCNLRRQYQQAIDALQRSVDMKRAMGDRSGEADSLFNLGTAYDALREHQQAVNAYQQSLTIAGKISDLRLQADIYFHRGWTLAKLNQKAEAQTSFEAAQALYKSLGLLQEAKDCDRKIQFINQPRTIQSIYEASDLIPTQRRPLWIWLLVGLGLALLLGWLLQ